LSIAADEGMLDAEFGCDLQGAWEELVRWPILVGSQRVLAGLLFKTILLEAVVKVGKHYCKELGSQFAIRQQFSQAIFPFK
jgi:hypothetical protein